jgi:hypothetical protein
LGRKLDAERAEQVFRDAGLIPLENFPGAKRGWLARCKLCGSEVKPHFHSILAGKGCRECGKRRSAAQQSARGLEIAIKVFSQAGLTLAGPYKNAKTPVLVKCMNCNHKFKAIQSSVKQGSQKCDCRKGPRRPLEVYYPELALEFHKALNGKLNIRSVGTGMRAQVWWECSKGHEFIASPASRISNRTGCPICSGRLALIGVSDLRAMYPEIFTQLSDPGRFKDVAVHPGSNEKLEWRCQANPLHLWEASVYSRVQGSGCPVCNGKTVLSGENDLESIHPELAEEWSSKNKLKSTQVHFGSQRKFLWTCRRIQSHEWSATVASRAKGAGCPICANQRLLVGFNDLATVFPELLPLWHAEKNGKLTPQDLIGASGKPVTWKCLINGDHFWVAPPSRLISQGAGCPICANRRVLAGQNDLANLDPVLASQWAHDLNPIGPQEVSLESHYLAWWRCSDRAIHTWRAAVAQRRRGTGCPYCAGRKVEAGFNDLASLHPGLENEWDRERNGALLPNQITAGSNRKVAWKCSKDPRHRWIAVASSRARGNGCPICSNKIIVQGLNDLRTVYPELAEQWNYRLNGSLSPDSFSSGSVSKVWWICSDFESHEWMASISSRTRLSVSCPICANLQVLAGFNDLGARRPEIAKTWHSSRNGSLSPDQVVPGTNRLVWWQCPSIESHVWRSSVKNRSKGKGCPQCTPAGYSARKTGYLYAIKHPGLKAKKVGITNTSAESGRLAHFQNLGWTILQLWGHEDGQVAQAAETRILRWVRQDFGLPPYLSPQDLPRIGGWSETFADDGMTDQEFVNECSRVVLEEIKRLDEVERF